MEETKSPQQAYENPEFLKSDNARTIRILSEYLEPLARLRKLKVNNTVLFLGSTRANPEEKNALLTKYYWEAEELAFLLAQWAIKLKPKGKNFVICTGGGPGIMEAANRGASRAGGKSIGMNISVPIEQALNPYVSPELSFLFHYFFMRKFWLLYEAKAIVAFPGGFGTLDEIFEILTLTQTGKIHKDHVLILLYGEKYWKEIINFDVLLKAKAIDPEELNLIHYCSKPREALLYLKENLVKFL
jgi:uncharacterized protein (TIGR00730 family)